MAKKRKKRRPQRSTRPAARPTAAAAPTDGGDAEQSPSRRAERKEEARRERERRIKQAKRRLRTRRLVRWGIAVGVVGLIAGGIYMAGTAGRQIEEEGRAAAQRLSCETTEQEPNLPNEHVEPFAQGENGVPAVGGNHTSALPAEPKVYTQQPPEESAIHNLEHGYVIVYYAADGDNALADDAVSGLEDLVNGESEVLMMPYEGLAKPLYLTAWGARQGCDVPADASPNDAVALAKWFIDEWKNGQFAPEAAAA